MHIVLVDDEEMVLASTKAMAESIGHTAEGFTNPLEALRAIDVADVDLVISDIGMAPMDGFRLASAVTDPSGSTPPRLLLASGDHEMWSRVDELPPALVMGLLRKPFGMSALSRVLSLVEQTRICCPGRIWPFCRFLDAHPDAVPRDPAGLPLCETQGYAACPHYGQGCGLAFRTWISVSSVRQGAGRT